MKVNNNNMTCLWQTQSHLLSRRNWFILPLGWNKSLNIFLFAVAIYIQYELCVLSCFCIMIMASIITFHFRTTKSLVQYFVRSSKYKQFRANLTSVTGAHGNFNLFFFVFQAYRRSLRHRNVIVIIKENLFQILDFM